jgi:hypothetical protein
MKVIRRGGAVLPYAGTSGHSGSDTSRERAERRDASGRTARSQQQIVSALRAAGSRGVTVGEMRERSIDHHGTVSGALSNLHKSGSISRLVERRNKCAIYVLPEHVDGRETASPGATSSRSRLLNLVDDLRRLCDANDFDAVKARIQQESERLP